MAKRRRTAVTNVIDENVLIDRILNGERQLYAQLVDRYKSYAFAIARKIVETKPEAEEAAQDAFIKAFQHLRSFQQQSRFSTWLYRIVFNTAISYQRKRKTVYHDIEKQILLHPHETGYELEREDKQRFVNQAIHQLNDAARMDVQLYYLQELSLEEVAGMMQQPLNTIKVRIHRARQRLAQELMHVLKQEALTL
ncbi:MAG TPA: RNA polymerase subunit sigma [Cytophagales bacterium]|nr:RNA polymerase subunit sigma [Cytophagales bacterium]